MNVTSWALGVESFAGKLAQVLDVLKAKGAPVVLTCEYEQWDDATEKNVRMCVEWFSANAK